MPDPEVGRIGQLAPNLRPALSLPFRQPLDLQITDTFLVQSDASISDNTYVLHIRVSPK